MQEMGAVTREHDVSMKKISPQLILGQGSGCVTSSNTLTGPTVQVQPRFCTSTSKNSTNTTLNYAFRVTNSQTTTSTSNVKEYSSLIVPCNKSEERFAGSGLFGAQLNGGQSQFAVRDDRTLCGLFGGCSSPNSIKIQSRSHKRGGG